MSTLPAQCGKTLQVLPPGLGTRKPSVTWVSEGRIWQKTSGGPKELCEGNLRKKEIKRKINLLNELAALGWGWLLGETVKMFNTDKKDLLEQTVANTQDVPEKYMVCM